MAPFALLRVTLGTVYSCAWAIAGTVASRCTVSVSMRTLAGSAAEAEALSSRGDLLAGESLRPLELVEVGSREREGRRPDELGLTLDVVVLHPHRIGRIDLVLGDERARGQREDVEPSRHLGAV